MRISVPALPGSEISAATAISRGRSASTSSRLVDGTSQTATSPTGVTVSDKGFRGAVGNQMDGHAAEHRLEAAQRGFGDEDLDHEIAPQRRLDEVGSLGEEACGTAPSDVAMQLDRCRHPVGALGERQAASPASDVAGRAAPDGAFTSSGSAPLATSTSAVKAAGSLTAISARFLRSTSTPAAFRP